MGAALLVIDVSGLNGYTMVDGRVLTRIRLSSFVATSVATLGPEFQQTTNFFRFAIARVGS